MCIYKHTYSYTQTEMLLLENQDLEADLALSVDRAMVLEKSVTGML